MTTAAIIPAAGRGERLGQVAGSPATRKALRPVGGAPILVHAAHTLAVSRAVDLVVVAAGTDDLTTVERVFADFEWSASLEVVAGGAVRRESVRNALAVLPDDVDVVLVHDAARPLAPAELADAVLARVRSGASACVPVMPLVDTVKLVEGSGSGDGGTVVRTLDRSGLFAVQTPQAFRREVLVKAHAWAEHAPAGQLATLTDDAGLVEALGYDVVTVPGSDEAFKVTRPIDLVLAEAVLARRRADGAT